MFISYIFLNKDFFVNFMWNSLNSTKELPKDIRRIVAEHSGLLRSDLDSNSLVVNIYPAREIRHTGHCIREAESINPRWYSELYSLYSSLGQYRFSLTGKLRASLHSKVQRKSIFSSLKRIEEGQDRSGAIERHSWTDFTCRNLILAHLSEGVEISGVQYFPNETIQKFFRERDGLYYFDKKKYVNLFETIPF
jgi:hypothetical protein